MTARQRRFIESYLAHGNAARAAREAGYAAGSARSTAARLLKTPAVRAAIDAVTAERAERIEIEQNQVLRALAYCAYARPDMFVVSDGVVTVREGVPEGFLIAVQGARFRETYDYDGKRRERTGSVILVDKAKALSLAMRHLGMLRDRLEVDVNAQFQTMFEQAAEEYDREIHRIAARRKKLNETKH